MVTSAPWSTTSSSSTPSTPGWSSPASACACRWTSDRHAPLRPPPGDSTPAGGPGKTRGGARWPRPSRLSVYPPPMPGYSGTPLVRKLGIKETHVVFLDCLPDGVDLGDLGPATVVCRLPTTADVTLTFHTDRAGLARRLSVVFERTTTDGMVWVCWPK